LLIEEKMLTGGGWSFMAPRALAAKRKRDLLVPVSRRSASRRRRFPGQITVSLALKLFPIKMRPNIRLSLLRMRHYQAALISSASKRRLISSNR
jgi:hypothetical protein